MFFVLTPDGVLGGSRASGDETERERKGEKSQPMQNVTASSEALPSSVGVEGEEALAWCRSPKNNEGGKNHMDQRARRVR